MATTQDATIADLQRANAMLRQQVAESDAECQAALARDAALAEVLDVINRSSGDPAPVFDAILEKAHRLCGATYGSLQLYNGDMFRAIAVHGFSGPMEEGLRQGYRPGPNMPIHRLLAGERVAHVADFAAVDDPVARSGVALGGIRTILYVALRKDGVLLGQIVAARLEVLPFSETEIALIESFAAQAVIAMENARLLEELRARTDDLHESLDNQTAIGDVLKAISRSAFDLEIVLSTVVASAVKLCRADRAILYRYRDGACHFEAGSNNRVEFEAFERANPIRPGRDSLAGRTMLEGRTVHIADALHDPEYALKDQAKLGGIRSMLGVPLLRDGTLVGVFALARTVVEPFSERQVELVTTFADQAVIAIENARLLGELRARTDELTRSVSELRALEEVLRAVNASLDLETVLATVINRAVPLAQADEGMIYEFDADEQVFVPKAAFGMSEERIARLRDRRIRLGETYLGRCAVERVPVHVEDIQQDISVRDIGEIMQGVHAALAVPLLREDAVVGALVIRRRREGGFSADTVALMQTFAAQCVLAIGNAQLFEESRRARAGSEAALADLKQAQDRLVQSEKMASLGQLTAGIAHEIKNPLNFVNNFSALSTELIDELREALAPEPIGETVRAEVNELTATIRSNLEKVVQHGKRADGIVKNMLLHSRESGGEMRRVELNAAVEEALNLAYHGARAEKPGFNITLLRNYDPRVGSVELYPQEFTRVLLNLISNGFYAATRKAGEPGFEPMLAVATEARAGEVAVRVRDNGIGIPDAVRGKMFEPFFTTKPAGEGTGLGLSLSHDIVVQQHGGGISVDSREGEFTEFTVVLPRGGG